MTAGFDDHHIINQKFQRRINRALRNTPFSYNLNTRPANRVLLPTTAAGAERVTHTLLRHSTPKKECHRRLS